jgi:cholesterol transport system auxiliary component
MMGRRLAIAALGLLLASCAGILPKPPPAPLLFRLTPLAATVAPTQVIDAQLVIDMPSAPASLDTERIALARNALSFDYFAGAAWIDRAPALLQSLIVESLENDGRIRVVARPAGDLRPDAVLLTDLRRFEADYEGADPPKVRVRLDCRLVRMPDRTVLSVRSFEGTATASANDMARIVGAFDEASHAAMRALAPWAAQTLAATRR